MTLNDNLFEDVNSQVRTFLATILEYGAIGEGNTTPISNDIGLDEEIFRDAFDDTDIAVLDEITVTLIIGANEANNSTIREAGVFLTPSFQVDSCDSITGWTGSTDATLSVNTNIFYEGTGSINLTKTGTSEANIDMFKTVTSRDFDDNYLSSILYISDATTYAKLVASGTAVAIRYGSDSSNYYEWDFTKSEVAIGKNFLDAMDSSNADSTTGTPDDDNMDYFRIIITTTAASDTWSAGDIIIDDIKIFGEKMYMRDILISLNKTDAIILYVDFTISISSEEV